MADIITLLRDVAKIRQARDELHRLSLASVIGEKELLKLPVKPKYNGIWLAESSGELHVSTWAALYHRTPHYKFAANDSDSLGVLGAMALVEIIPKDVCGVVASFLAPEEDWLKYDTWLTDCGRVASSPPAIV